MATIDSPQKSSKALLWTGRIISAIPVLMMAGIGTVMLILRPDGVGDDMAKFGYPKQYAIPILIIEIVCALLYAIPQTATLGAILLTAYLGGAVATHVRAAELAVIPMPVLVAIFVWLGLLLREPRLRPLLPFRRL